MARLILDPDAEAELDALYDENEDTAADFDLLLERLGEDEKTLEFLCLPENNFKYSPPYEVKKFIEAQNIGRNIFSIKTQDTDGHRTDYRMLIGHDAQKNIYHVLAVTNRDYSYDPGHESFKQLLKRYDDSDIPTYPRR